MDPQAVRISATTSSMFSVTGSPCQLRVLVERRLVGVMSVEPQPEIVFRTDSIELVLLQPGRSILVFLDGV
jgi:hypothetical protein